LTAEPPRKRVPGTAAAVVVVVVVVVLVVSCLDHIVGTVSNDRIKKTRRKKRLVLGTRGQQITTRKSRTLKFSRIIKKWSRECNGSQYDKVPLRRRESSLQVGEVVHGERFGEWGR
jgi:hypothetical protein